MAAFDPDKYLAQPDQGFDPDAYLRGSDAKPAPKRPLSFMDALKIAAKPDIFNTEGAAYELGGKVTDATGSPVAGYVTNVAAQALPTIVGAFGGSAVGRPAMEAVGRRTMQSAIKPSAANLDRGKVAAAVETMLEKGYSPTNAGVAAMRDRVGTLAADADAVLSSSNKAIDLSRALQNVGSVADKARAATTGVRDADVALDVAKQLMAHPAVDAAGLMSVPAAQAMKSANYKALGDAAYGMGLKPAAERDALKAATAALRQNLERAEPAVAPINKEMAELMNAIKVSQRRALMEGNKDILPLGASVATAMNNPVAALGLYANSSAAVKAMLARALHQGAKGVPAAVGGTVGAAAGAESGRPKQDALAEAIRKYMEQEGR